MQNSSETEKDLCALCNAPATKRCRDYHGSCIELPWEPEVTDREITLKVSKKDIERANGLHTPLCYPIQRLLCNPWIVQGGVIVRDPALPDTWDWIHIDRAALLLLWKWTNHQPIQPTTLTVWIPERFLRVN